MITRSPRRQTYTIIDNEIMNDERLKADAVGVLVYLLSKPDNWRVRSSHLMARFGCGRNKIYQMLKQLREFGYAEYTRSHTGETDWIISEDRTDTPYTENQHEAQWPRVRKPHEEKPHEDIQHVLVSTERAVSPERAVSNNQLTLMSDSDESDLFEDIWKLKPKRPNQSKAKTKKAYNARIKEGIPHADLLAGLLRYNAYSKAEGTAPQFIKQLSTFLNADKHWNEAWEVSEKVPPIEDTAAILRCAQEKGVNLPDNCTAFDARKIIAKEARMQL